jgi:hypothetical protein
MQMAGFFVAAGVVFVLLSHSNVFLGAIAGALLLGFMMGVGALAGMD